MQLEVKMACTHAVLVHGAKYRGSCVLGDTCSPFPVKLIICWYEEKSLDYKSKWITVQHQSGDIAVTYIEK